MDFLIEEKEEMQKPIELSQMQIDPDVPKVGEEGQSDRAEADIEEVKDDQDIEVDEDAPLKQS